MSCPFFMPTERRDSPLWPHPQRLPLGTGWKGCCTASTDGTPAVFPVHREDQLSECNLGYPKACPRLPQEREADAVRFGVTKDREQRIALRWVCEKDYRPGAHGLLEYDCRASSWIVPHQNANIQRMAECYLESYLNRRNSSAIRAPE